MASRVGVAAEQILDASAIGARRRAEDACERAWLCAVRCAPRRSERIFVVGLVARRDRLHRGIEQRDLRREKIAEQPGDAPRHIDARAADRGRRQHFDAGDAPGGMVPDRPAAHQRKALCDLLAAGAQRRAAPQVDHDARGASRHASADGARTTSSAASRPRSIAVWRRQSARIGGEEIAAGRQHVAPSAARRAGRAGRDATAVESGEQRGAFGSGARLPVPDRRVLRGARP